MSLSSCQEQSCLYFIASVETLGFYLMKNFIKSWGKELYLQSNKLKFSFILVVFVCLLYLTGLIWLGTQWQDDTIWTPLELITKNMYLPISSYCLEGQGLWCCCLIGFVNYWQDPDNERDLQWCYQKTNFLLWLKLNSY